MDIMENESDTAQLLGSNIARRGKKGKRRNQDYVHNGHSMTVLSEPETLPADDDTREAQRLKRLRGLSGSLGDSLPSVRAQLAANLYAESNGLHKRSTKETTPLLTKDEEKGGVSNDSSSSDSLGLSGGYDAVVKHAPVTKGKRVKKAVKKW
jgi:hypothetical protein